MAMQAEPAKCDARVWSMPSLAVQAEPAGWNAVVQPALLYSDVSVLEMHHLSMAFSILQQPDSALLSSLPLESRKEVRRRHHHREMRSSRRV